MGSPAVRFGETLWSTVLKARDRSPSALGRVAHAYWKPVYFFVRRRGRSVEDAKDLTQGFFASLLERDALAGVDPRRGKFRTFLLACLDRYLSNERERAAARKRGAGKAPLDLREAERELTSRADTPEEAFERGWRADVLARAFERMRGAPHFDAFALAMSEGLGPSEIAARLRLKPKDAENAILRARSRYRELVLAEIRLDVETRAEAEEELARILETIR